MFAQVIEGQIRDRDALQAQLDRWMTDLAPSATGWLGTTGGVAEDGTVVAVIRFESEAAARANSERPEQGEWWAQTAPAFDGEVTFRDCPVVDSYGRGGSDDAGFVQVIFGTADRDRLLADQAALDEFLSRTRPDVIGGTMAWPGDGSFVQVVYFTSEADARKNEGAELSDEDAARLGETMSAMDMQRFVDLREPMLHSA